MTSAPLAALGSSAQSYLGKLFQIESGGDPNNKTGSNFGLAQFGYADMKRFGLSDPFDPGQATTAALKEMQQNRAALTAALGRPVTDADLYLAHQQGLAGSEALFKNPDMPAWQAIRPYYSSDNMAQLAITGNAGNLNMTSSQFTSMWQSRFNGMNPLDLSKFNGVDAALKNFETTTQGATQNLTGFGGGLQQVTNSLVGSAGSATGAGGGGLGGLFGSIFSLFHFADGGHVKGPGTSRSDSIPAMLSDGEYVINADATKKHLPLLHAINEGHVARFADGGQVGGSSGGLSFLAVKQQPAGPTIHVAPTINLTASGGSAEQNQDLASRLGTQITTQIRNLMVSEMANQLRQGGLLQKAIG